MKFDRVADVVVVGSGAAAFAAAVAAAGSGCQVLMLEKAGEVGGTTRRSGGTAWILNNRFMRARAVADPRQAALKHMARLSYPTQFDPETARLGLSANDYELLATYYDRGAEAMLALERAGALGTVADFEQPDYSADMPDNEAPRGRYLRPKAFLDPAAHFGDGVDLIAQLHAAAEQLNVQLLLEHDVTECMMNGTGEVVGLYATRSSGTGLFGARKGIVFGTGGFLHNEQMCADFLRGPIFGGCAVPTNTGAFARIGMELGADMGNMSQAWWSEVVVDMALDKRSTPNTIFMPGGDSMILVNRHGRRVVNEKMPYNERTQVHFYWDPVAREYPNLLLFCLFDDAMARNPAVYRTPAMRLPVPMPGETRPPWVISGADWSELAVNLRRRLAHIGRYTGGLQLSDGFLTELGRSIARFNNFAKAGKDDDFHRGETPIQLHWGGTRREGNDANPTMFPFDSRGPYHAVILGGGALDTKGGPRIDPMGRVLRPNGRPIPGLFGAGNCVASPAGQGYWAAGGTIGPALVFGYLAGEAAAANMTRDLDAI